jgi:hypothetical protein
MSTDEPFFLFVLMLAGGKEGGEEKNFFCME